MSGDPQHNTSQFEVLGVLRERVATVEQKSLDLATRIDIGDNNVRQGIEVLKGVVMNMESSLERKVDRLQNTIDNLDDDFQRHLNSHGRSAGARSVKDKFREQFAAPIITGILVGLPALILAWLALERTS